MIWKGVNMKLIDLLEIIPDCEYVEVVNASYDTIAIYDGKNEISSCLNGYEVICLATTEKFVVNGKLRRALKISLRTLDLWNDVN